MSMNLKLLEMLADIHKNSRSGIVRIERGPEKKQLVLDKGSLVFAESNLPAEHLVRIMVKLGLLRQAETKEIASLMKEGKTSEEAVLALSSSGMEGLGQGRREQAILILSSLLNRDECGMRFYPGEGLVKYRLNLSLPLPELIIESVRRAVSGRLFLIPSNFLQGNYCAAGTAARGGLDFPLSSAESRAYSLMQQPARAADVASRAIPSETKPEEVIFCLFILGLIAPREPTIQEAENARASDSPDRRLDDMLARFETAGLYEILSVQSDASADVIQAAYYDLARQFHPDRFQSREFPDDVRRKSERVFSLINEAYLTLKTPASRDAYDATRLAKESKVEAELKSRAGGQPADKETAEGLFREGCSLLAGGNYEKAAERLKGSVWLCPDNAAYHHYLGVALSEIPKFRKSAEQHLLKALDLDKTYLNSRLELAKLYIKVDLPRRAELQLRELIRWDPENPKAHKLLDELKSLPSK